MSKRVSRFGTSAAVLLAAVALFLSGGAAALEINDGTTTYDGTVGKSWDGITGGIVIQPAGDPGSAFTVNVKDHTATVTGGLTLDVYNRDDSTKKAAVDLKIDSATINFSGGGWLQGDYDVEAERATHATLTLGSTTVAHLSFGGNLMASTARISVMNSSTLSVGGMLSINDPSLDDIPYPTTDDPDDMESSLHVEGTVNVTGGLALNAGRIHLKSGSITAGAFSMGDDYNENIAEIYVRAGTSFRMTDTGVQSFISGGTFNMEYGAGAIQFLGGFEVGYGGVMKVTREVDLGTTGGMRVSAGGTVNINSGSVNGEYIHVNNGKLYHYGGVLGGTDFTVSGDASDVVLGSYIDPKTGLSVSGGSVRFLSGARSLVDDTVSLSALHVSGTANLSTSAKISIADGAGNFSFAGGDITIDGSALGTGGLAVGATGQNLTLRGNLHMYGGEASFKDNVTWSNGGGLFAYKNVGLDMNGKKLTIASGSILDASGGNIRIDNSGGLSITGSYRAGHNGASVNLASTHGGGPLHLSEEADIQLSSELQRKLNTGSGLAAPVLILESDSSAYNGATELSWNSGGWLYQYEMRQDGNNWGLYVVGAEYLTEEEQYRNMLDAWRRNPDVGDNAPKLIRPDFAGVVIRANGIVSGGSGDYDALSKNGQFNADVLASLLNPKVSEATYDALMLYNGAGMGVVNQAVINQNSNLLRRLRQRNDQLRHELYSIGYNQCTAGVIDHSDCCSDGDKNRVWVAAHYSNEDSNKDEGFKRANYQSHGLVVGYDRLIGNLAVGGAFSYTTGDLEDHAAIASNSEINSYGFNVYGTYNLPNGWFVNGAMGYVYSDDQIRDYRMLNEVEGWNSADYHTNSFIVNVNVGRDWRPSDVLTITGTAGLAYQRSENAAHSQFFQANDNSVGANTLNAGAVNNHSLTLPLEVAANYNIYADDDTLFNIFGHLGYAYEFNNSGASGRVTYGGLENLGAVKIVSRHPGRHVLNVGLGFKYYYKSYEFGLSYDFQNRENYDSHQLLGNFGVVF